MKHAPKKQERRALMPSIVYGLISFMVILSSCQKKKEVVVPGPQAYKITKNISYNGVDVDIIIDKPPLNEMDVLMVYHGTRHFDSLILDAAENILTHFKEILNEQNMMIVSVAYPEENLLMGDNLLESEAALLWVQHKAEEELGITIKKLFLAGHSQGAYIVTRLNTMHHTDGVIANAPGPLNLVYRCQLEENGTIPNGITCDALFLAYGSTTDNPDAYMNRSLLHFTNGFKSDILFIQGLKDGHIQRYSWPTFKQKVRECTDCKNVTFLEIPQHGHTALFTSEVAQEEFNAFLKRE